ncbi:MAG: PAS domain-containing protein [Labilithrix sp.]|nr:PAS domain-containing protein [Labilithrix sp.]MBX3223430.1 PAS domain-containing protein [Labilithrix sp.]
MDSPFHPDMTLGARPKRRPVLLGLLLGALALGVGSTTAALRTRSRPVPARPASADHFFSAERIEAELEEDESKAQRAGLVLLSVVLFGALGVMIVRLRRNATDLERALVSLESEKRVVEEKRRELAALNQSLETRVEARTRELSGSREQYRVLLETTQAIPWEMAPGRHRFAYVGPQAAPMLGRPLSEWAEDGFLERTLHPEDLADARAWLDNLSTDGAKAEIELRFLSASGQPVWLRAFASTALDEQRRPVRRGILLDVTTRHVLEAELRSAQKLEAVGRLAAGIAHEINTPVQFVSDSVHFVTESFTGLASLVESFRRLLAVGPEERVSAVQAARAADEAADTDYVLANIPQALASSVEGLDRIAAIVRSLKQFSHPDGQQKSSVDLNASIRSTLTIAAHEYKHVADVSTDLGEIPLVTCHGGELNQVLLNLVINAAHAISDVVEGTDRRGIIKIRTWHEGSTVLICVRDTGTGIPPKIRHKIFEPFFTTKDVGRGTGQGLSLARSLIVDKHGGELTFETELGRGTAFLIRLPVEQGAVPVAA